MDGERVILDISNAPLNRTAVIVDRQWQRFNDAGQTDLLQKAKSMGIKTSIDAHQL